MVSGMSAVIASGPMKTRIGMRLLLQTLGLTLWLGSGGLASALSSFNVRTINGQTVVIWNGRQVFSGPTKTAPRARSSTINGQEFAAVFDGDQVIWENVRGAGEQLKAQEAGVKPPVRRDEGALLAPFGGGRGLALPFGAFNFQQQFNGLGNGGVSVRSTIVNGQATTKVMVNGEEVYSGPSSGSVRTRTEMMDGEPRTLVLDGDKILWDSRKPKDEFALDKNPGPVLPAGILLTDSTWVKGTIVSMDATKASLRRDDGQEDSILLARVAVVLFRPIPESKRAALTHDSPGLLLRNGDYLESEPKSLHDGQVTTSSILYGPKNFSIEEAVALVLRKPDRP
jgi:hypothetical protein